MKITRHKLKKWYKLERGVEKKRHKTNGCKTRPMCICFKNANIIG